MKISIVIPNFNGEKLLEKNLPNVLNSEADEVIVLDDCSTDKSKEILDKFKNNDYKLPSGVRFKILIHKKNQGFVTSVNELFNSAQGDVVVLLNNDVWVEKDFLKPLIKHFHNPKVFAVNLHEDGEGPALSFWKDGFFEFKRGEEKEVVQKSAWASGGSAAFRKKIWQELGGFDKIFAPFYWEDTDIAFRALKAGYEILWEPNSKVRHEHETTIKKTFSKRYISWVKQRNQLLFIWKNISDPKLKAGHKISLLKRLLTKPGYWMPYLWAVLRLFQISHDRSTNEIIRNDLEVINYAQNSKLSVITVTFNNEEQIDKYVSSVLKFLPGNGELIILDNNSNDATVKILEKFGQAIKLIKSSENLGFARGNNKAAEQSAGDYLFFLNPDTEIKVPVFEELIEFYKNTPDAGIIGPKLVMADGETQPSVRKLPSVWGAVKEFIFGMENEYSQYVPSVSEPTEVETVYGAAMLISNELFERLEGFDEKYFLYYEDADLCKRVRELGKKVYYYPGVSIKHLIGASKSDQDRYKLNLESARKYHGAIGAFLLQLIFLIPRLRRKL